jgi:thiol:disulfide interchange protein DsbA
MRSLRTALAALGLLAATAAFASPTAPVLGKDYTQLAAPQPVQTVGNKVEVLEFFMYRCPHCAGLEPALEAWLKKQGDNVVLRRVHFGTPADPGAHLYLALDAMGKANEMSQKVFDAIHKQHIRLDADQDLVFDWIGKNGIDKRKFTEAWNSFGVMIKLRQINQVAAAYKVEFAPTLIVGGKYVTSPSMIGVANHINDEAVLDTLTPQVLDALVAKVRAEKK